MQELWLLHSARLMLIDINMKVVREDSLNGFQVIERTQFYDRVQEK